MQKAKMSRVLRINDFSVKHPQTPLPCARSMKSQAEISAVWKRDMPWKTKAEVLQEYVDAAQYFIFLLNARQQMSAKNVSLQFSPSLLTR